LAQVEVECHLLRLVSPLLTGVSLGHCAQALTEAELLVQRAKSAELTKFPRLARVQLVSHRTAFAHSGPGRPRASLDR
jgi:hypothetical protein